MWPRRIEPGASRYPARLRLAGLALAGATLLVSPHGAHLTNAMWLPEGATLVEVMPWGMSRYRGYHGLFLFVACNLVTL